MVTRFKDFLGMLRKPTGRRGQILRAGLAAVLTAAVFITGLPYSNTVLSAVSANGRKLPVYSVRREDKKISISFDAAW